MGRDIITHNPQGGRRNSIDLTHNQKKNDHVEVQHKPKKRIIQSNQKDIRLCPEALVANFNE